MIIELFRRWRERRHRAAGWLEIALLLQQIRKHGGSRDQAFLFSVVLGLFVASWLFGWLPRLPSRFASRLANDQLAMWLWVLACLAVVTWITVLLLKLWRKAGRGLAWLIVFSILAVASLLVKVGILEPMNAASRSRATAHIEAAPANPAVAAPIQSAADPGARWRAEIVGTGATGAPGVVPPMLAVREVDGTLEIANLDPRAACVLVSRIAAAPDGTKVRCPVGPPVCRAIAPGAALRFLQYRSSPQVCAQAPLEFRVGGPDLPGPAWWTTTALEDLARTP